MLSALQQWGENQQQQQQQEVEADLEPLRRQQMLQQIMALRALQPMPVMHEMERRMCAYQRKRQLAAALLQVQLRQVLLERQQARQQHQQQGNLQQPGQGEQQRQQEVQVQAGQQQGVKQPRRWQGRKHRSPAILQREYRQQKQYRRWLVYQEKQARKAQQAELQQQAGREGQSAEMLFSAGTDSDTDADACIAAILSSFGIGTATREVLEHDSTGDSQDGADNDTTATSEPAVASQEEKESDTEQPPARQRQLQQSSHSVAPWSLGFLYKAASPGVLRAVLQHHPGDLSVTSCSLAYARLAELCRDSPALLQHQYTQQLLRLLQTELPRLQQQVQLWHLATMSAAALSLQQPQLARVMLPQLLQHPQRQDPVQLLCSVVACVRLQQTGLSKALLRLLLLGDGVLAPQPGSVGKVAAFAGLTDRPLLQQQQQQLLSMLMAEVDTGNVQQVTVAFWVACCTLPDCESQARELLRAFVQLLPDATAPSVVLVLSCVQAAKWEYVPWGRLKQLLLAAEQLLLEMSARQIATILLCTSRRNLEFQFGEQLHAFHNAFVERLPTATVSDICGVCWAAAVTGRRLHFRSIGPMMDRVVQQLPAVMPVQASMLLWSLATMRITLREGDHVHQLVAVALADAVRGAAAVNKVNVVLLKKITWAAAIIGQPLPLEQLQQIEAAWVDVWSCARAAEQSQQVSTFEALCTALWSFAQLLYYPKNLLTVITKNKKLFEECMKSASTQHLSMAVVAYAALGPVGGFPWYPLTYAAVRRVNQLGIKAVGCQTAANLCWALVVRGRKLHKDGSKIDQLAAACASVWQNVGRAERQQLLHVHVLLKHLGQTDLRRPFGGLSGVLSARQLADCSAAWEPGANEPARLFTSKLQQQVYDLLLQLPDSTWQREGGAPVLEQLAADGISSIDIAATRQDGLRLAIEVDGPMHFLRPDNTLDGRTKSRNRLLQAQGWTIVSIPYFEFQAVPADQPEQQLQYLAQKVQGADADFVHW